MLLQPFQTLLLLFFAATIAILSISANSAESAEASYNWYPQEEHPCNIRKISLNHLDRVFAGGKVPPLYHEPLVLTASATSLRNQDFRKQTALDRILENFPPDFNVTLSSSNSLSEHRRETTLKQYLNETVGAGETLLDQKSSENWYLFGHTYTKEWQEVTQHYELPPCRTCRSDLSALSFGIGNRGSGVQWHVHGPGFGESLHGRKHWVLYPRQQKPEKFDKDQSSRQWMEWVYPFTNPKPYECTLNPGDMIYFPDDWWHATINLDPYTAFISTFTTEHKLDRFAEL